jgi:hypothetical protein
MIHLVALIARQWRGLSLKSFTVAIGMVYSGYAFAGSPAEEAAQKLTGGGSREWTFVQMRKLMGAEQNCIEGEVYEFSSEKSLTIEQCVNGKVNITKHLWSIEETTPIDITISIDGKQYLLLFKESDKSYLMKLRTLAESKLTPTIDKEFSRLKE